MNIKAFEKSFEQVKKQLQLPYPWKELNLNVLRGKTDNYYIPTTDEILINSVNGKCQLPRFAHEIVHKYFFDIVQSPILEELKTVRGCVRKKVRNLVEVLDKMTREEINKYLNDQRRDTYSVEKFLANHRRDYLIWGGLLKIEPLLPPVLMKGSGIVNIPRCYIKDGNMVGEGPCSTITSTPTLLSLRGAEDYFSEIEKELLGISKPPTTKLIKDYERNNHILTYPIVRTTIDEALAHIIKAYFEGRDLRSKETRETLKRGVYDSAYWGRDKESLYIPLELTLKYIDSQLANGTKLEEILRNLLHGDYLKMLCEQGFIKSPIPISSLYS